jgi:LPXTG-motif cell wall-anchored protein
MKRCLLLLSATAWTVGGAASIAFAQYPPTSRPAIPTASPGGAEPDGGTLPFTGERLSLWFALLPILILAGILLLFMQRRRQTRD